MIKIPLSETFPSVKGKFALHFNLLMPQFLLVLLHRLTVIRTPWMMVLVTGEEDSGLLLLRLLLQYDPRMEIQLPI